MPTPALRSDVAPRSPGTHSTKILILENDRRSAEMLAGLLRMDGFDVEVCADGRCAERRLALAPVPDVLITDLRPPQVDGITVARLARAHNPAMELVIVTAYPDLAARIVAGAPAPRVFTKPLDYRALVESLTGITEREGP